MATDLNTRKVVRVPDVSRQPLAKARILLEDAGLGEVVVLYQDSYEHRDTVLDQRPGRGQMVHSGTEVTIWVARRGLFEHLPAIYRRSDAVGQNVIRDLCFLFEHMFGPVEETIDHGQRYYDPLDCPPEFLSWLSQWTAFALDLDWPEEKQRALLKRSVDLYRIRGTKRGLSLFLRLFTGHEPEITENTWPFRGFRVESEARIALDSVIMPPVDLARCFVVDMPIRFDQVTAEEVIRIHQIIQLEKPAHTQYYLRFSEEDGDAELREFFSIGLRSGIGIGAEVVDEEVDEELGLSPRELELKAAKDRAESKKTEAAKAKAAAESAKPSTNGNGDSDSKDDPAKDKADEPTSRRKEEK